MIKRLHDRFVNGQLFFTNKPKQLRYDGNKIRKYKAWPVPYFIIPIAFIVWLAYRHISNTYLPSSDILITYEDVMKNHPGNPQPHNENHKQKDNKTLPIDKK